jgi:hypothetical protein
MKFLLTIYICSAIGGECVIPNDDAFKYPKEFGTHFGCVREGLSDSFEILYAGDYFNADAIESYKLYPTFSCNKVTAKDLIPPPKPKVEIGEPA